MNFDLPGSLSCSRNREPRRSEGWFCQFVSSSNSDAAIFFCLSSHLWLGRKLWTRTATAGSSPSPSHLCPSHQYITRWVSYQHIRRVCPSILSLLCLCRCFTSSLLPVWLATFRVLQDVLKEDAALSFRHTPRRTCRFEISPHRGQTRVFAVWRYSLWRLSAKTHVWWPAWVRLLSVAGAGGRLSL